MRFKLKIIEMKIRNDDMNLKSLTIPENKEYQRRYDLSKYTKPRKLSKSIHLKTKNRVRKPSIRKKRKSNRNKVHRKRTRKISLRVK